MALDMEYFRSIQGAYNINTYTDIKIAEAKDRLSYDMPESINCCHDSLRNGVSQKFIITTTDKVSMMDIIAFPNEELYIGDMIDALGEKWIVTEMYATDFIQAKGKMLQCNQLFKWQNFGGDVLEYWGVLDSGVYSTSEKSTDMMIISDQQFKVYLPYNDDTKKIYEGKRFATEVIYNNNGEQELACYRVTAVDSQSESYGGGKILMLKLRSDTFKRGIDNIELGVCDYVDPSVTLPTTSKGGWFDD